MDRLKIAIYKDFLGDNNIGGGDLLAVALAEAFQEHHDVDFIHDNLGITQESIADFFGINLDRTNFRLMKLDPPEMPRKGWGLMATYRAIRDRDAKVSAGYDRFIAINFLPPPYCHSRVGTLLIMFPAYDRRTRYPWRSPHRVPGAALAREVIVGWMYFPRRFASYNSVLTISEYARTWTRKWWGVDSEVVYPPVPTCDAPTVEKMPVILSVGRFHSTKKQRVMVDAFVSAYRDKFPGWSYGCWGGLSDAPSNHEYFAGLQGAAAGAPVELVANAGRAELDAALDSASIFWHGMGAGEDEEANPVPIEHFGISTVEAMARGCVPVVIRKGGQPEIVRHGVDGFTWETPEELVSYTAQLVGDEGLRRRMAESSRQRALEFGKDRYVREMARHAQIPLA